MPARGRPPTASNAASTRNTADHGDDGTAARRDQHGEDGELPAQECAGACEGSAAGKLVLRGQQRWPRAPARPPACGPRRRTRAPRANRSVRRARRSAAAAVADASVARRAPRVRAPRQGSTNAAIANNTANDRRQPPREQAGQLRPRTGNRSTAPASGHQDPQIESVQRLDVRRQAAPARRRLDGNPSPPAALRARLRKNHTRRSASARNVASCVTSRSR